MKRRSLRGMVGDGNAASRAAHVRPLRRASVGANRGPMTRLDPLARVRALCLALPEAQEKEAWGEPTFRVRDKIFAMYAAAGNHHGAGRAALWCKAPFGEQDLLVRADPARYFVPPYVGVRGWVGVVLDDATDWDALADLLADAWRLTAPRRLAATLARS